MTLVEDQLTASQGRYTWVPSTTICTSIVAWDGLDQFLKCSLIACLVALAEGGGHAAGLYPVLNRAHTVWLGGL